jgi:phenylpropionate dioxygenase-like ring-hydroxylating dioxygenase large terminal subunit
MEQLFKRVPLVATVSARLPEPGTSIGLDIYGLPLLITRDRDGVAHIFINACRHRGSKIVEGCEARKGGRLSCPYHAWTYDLKGDLVGIPRHDTFPSLNKADLGLIKLPSFESGGFIWVGIEPKNNPQPLPQTDAFCADMEAFGLDKMFMYGHRTYDLPSNWKFVIEPFLEGYHVQRLHAQSIGAMFADVPTVCAQLGHHQRQTSGKANFDPAVLDDNPSNLHRYITHAYLGFPNTIIVTSPYYISVMVLMPKTRERTMVEYHMMVKSAPDNPKAEDVYKRSFELIHTVFGGEDFRAACIQQEAMNSGAIPEVYYGGLEKMVGVFHESIESFLDNSRIDAQQL